MLNFNRNIYDFDGTIYDGDSAIDLYLYCVSKKKRILCDLPLFIIPFLKYKLNIISRTEVKQEFYHFLKRMKLTDNDLEDFWNIHIKKIKPWYMQKKCNTDIIISASPQFLLAPVKKYLSIDDVIASEVDRLSGKCLGPNCRGEQKVIRLKKKYPHIIVNEFYSDNISDQPLANIANKSYFVNRNNIRKWDFK